MAALAAMQSALFGQSLVGTWQGSLKVPQAPKGELRLVFKVATTPDDKLKADLYSIDQAGGQAIPATVSSQGTAVKISVEAVVGTFEGKLSADGNTIAGNWSQGPNPIALTLERANPQTAWTIPDPPPPPKLMAPDSDPSFEVATIKPSDPDHPKGKSLTINRSNEFNSTSMTMNDLITFSLGMHMRQIVGAPDWFATDKFDITAKSDTPGQPSTKQLATMMRKLLVERFNLKFHNDKKELSAYVLTVGKTGEKLKKTENNPNGLPGLGFRGRPGRFIARNATMADFTGFMQSLVLDRPVVDRTGLTTRYDFTLDWTPDETQFTDRQGIPLPPPDPNAETFPDLFTAIQQQLGLKLEAAKTPVDVMVIDHVEKPSAN